ncbi:MAG: 3' terminal RNA ribose 2'-O-methyltransferase Hen1 [Cyanobacteria bacterium J06623_7]
MLLTIATTYQPATDLGFLLHKHPDKCQSFPLNIGQAHVFYPESGADKCTAALLLSIDPVELVRGKSDRHQSLGHYVSDRPYVASSLMSVAISKVFRTALAGRCDNKPELVQQALPLTAKLPVLPCRDGESFLRQLFEPLGYRVEAETLPLDSTFPKWSNSIYLSVTLHQTIRLCDLLSHLYVLIPVLDDDKHYWVGDEEIAKLLRHGQGWLDLHPYKEQITKRYLKRQGKLTRKALAQLTIEDSQDNEIQNREEAAIEKPLSLNQQRMEQVAAVLETRRVESVIDLGCGEGKLIKRLLQNKSIHTITGVDVAHRELEIAQKRLKLDRLPCHQQDRVKLIQGSLIYRDRRFSGYDAATAIEVIEHLDLNRLGTLARVLFEFAQPKLVIVTTPNSEYNVRFTSLPSDKLRHRDHRFEWTRQEFQNWANNVAEKFSYRVEFQGIGEEDTKVGTPTQMAVFRKG